MQNNLLFHPPPDIGISPILLEFACSLPIGIWLYIDKGGGTANPILLDHVWVDVFVHLKEYYLLIFIAIVLRFNSLNQLIPVFLKSNAKGASFHVNFNENMFVAIFGIFPIHY